MKHFNLEEYIQNPSRKVVTRDGRNARIICTDAKALYPIIALVESPNHVDEIARSYTKDGFLYPGEEYDSDHFVAPEKHEVWVNVHKVENTPYLDTCIWPTEECAKKGAKYTDNYVATVKIEWEE